LIRRTLLSVGLSRPTLNPSGVWKHVDESVFQISLPDPFRFFPH